MLVRKKALRYSYSNCQNDLFPWLHQEANRMVRAHAWGLTDQENLVSECIAIGYRAAQKADKARCPSGYIVRSMLNRIRDVGKRKKVKLLGLDSARLVPSTDQIQAVDDRLVFQAQLKALFRSLNPIERVIILCLVDGLTMAETAQEVGVAPATLADFLHKRRHHWRARIEGLCGYPD